MRKLLQRLVLSAPVDGLLRRVRRRSPVILMYHGFCARGEAAGRLPASAFEAQADYLRRRHAVVPLARLLDALAGGEPLPDNAVVITIDDGYRSVYEAAYPILKRAGLPASLFLVTGFLDRAEPLWTDRVTHAMGGDPDEPRVRAAMKALQEAERLAALERLEKERGRALSLGAGCPDEYRPLEWPQVREMAASGLISIGSHTDTHPILTRCAPQDARRELADSKRILEERLQAPCDLFCYPNGWHGDFDESTRTLLKELGYRCGITTVPGFTREGDDPYALKRFGTDDEGALDDFRRTFSLGRSWGRRMRAAMR
ncbi:MAG TPA: polysaccharide deacetylase family protein [Elusimicrobiota bacterium]|nr:polysaccharide deacetylase family protein [Elusimicrobiota bacterium]